MKKYEQIADSLRSSISSLKGGFLPPVRELSRQLQASPATVLKALHLLRDENLIRIRPGGTITILTGSVRPGAVEGGPAAQKFARMLAEQLDSNTVKAGEYLPKVGYYTARLGLSPATVCGGFTLLADKGLIHKRGRVWIAGPVPPDRSGAYGTGRGGGRPFVLMLFPDAGTWNFYQGFFLYRDLFRRLLRELQGQGVGVRIAFEKETDGADTVPAGWRVVSKLIRENGGDLVGIFMGHGSRFTGRELRWPGLAAASGRKCVVLEGWDRPAAPPDYGERFFRAAINEEAALLTALQKLHARGHRNAAFVQYPSEPDRLWQRNRLALLQGLAGGMQPAMAVVPVTTAHINGIADGRGSFGQRNAVLGHVRARGADTSGAGQPELAACLRRGDVTALIASNDICASNLYLWLTHAGYAVPRDVSLISFDNSQHETPYPVSTIDFCYEELGYRIAHTLLGDIPAVSDRRRNVFAAPVYVDRGSVGRAGG